MGRYILLTVALLGCGQQITTECLTPYKMNVLPQQKGDYLPYTCSDFAAVEARVFEVFPKLVKDPRFARENMRLRVENLRIEVNPKLQWERLYFENGKLETDTVGGETLCPMRTIRINTDNDLWQSSYTHELAHWIQDCAPRGPLDTSSLYAEQHSNWISDGIYDAIDTIYLESQELKP